MFLRTGKSRTSQIHLGPAKAGRYERLRLDAVVVSGYSRTSERQS